MRRKTHRSSPLRSRARSKSSPLNYQVKQAPIRSIPVTVALGVCRSSRLVGRAQELMTPEESFVGTAVTGALERQLPDPFSTLANLPPRRRPILPEELHPCTTG